jgi:tetratricopeptide (TPR) repeat protein
VLNPLPTLRWNAVPGAKSYTASIISEDDAIWETKVKETEVIYSGTPRLESGVDYLLSIAADTGASSQDEDLPCLGFCLLDKNRATLIRDSRSQLLNQELTDEAKALATVHLYMKYELTAEAIEILTELVKRGSKLAAIHRTLGNLYEEVGLNRLAETCYLKATQLAADVEDIEGQALAGACLGDVYNAIANQPEAIHWLIQARHGYERLGDTQRVSEIAQQLTQLK